MIYRNKLRMIYTPNGVIKREIQKLVRLSLSTLHKKTKIAPLWCSFLFLVSHSNEIISTYTVKFAKLDHIVNLKLCSSLFNMAITLL